MQYGQLFFHKIISACNGFAEALSLADLRSKLLKNSVHHFPLKLVSELLEHIILAHLDDHKILTDH